MINNKADNYDNVVQELENQTQTTNVKTVNGNTITFELSQEQFGYINIPAYPNWYVTKIQNVPFGRTVTISHIE